MAVVTNVRDPLAAQTGPSRGALVADFLRGRDPAAVHIDRLATVAGAYAPFNLLLADSDGLEYLGNHPAERQTLARAYTACPTARWTRPGRRPAG